MKRILKNKKGFMLPELLLAGTMIFGAILPIVSALRNFNDAKERIQGRVESKAEALHMLQVIGHTIKFAETCISRTENSLECDVRGVDGIVVTRKFAHDSENLSYVQKKLEGAEVETKEIWKIKIPSFGVCTADALLRGQCLATGTTWQTSDLSTHIPATMRHYFQIKFTVLVNGEVFGAQGGFFNRNMGSGPKFAWVPMGGS